MPPGLFATSNETHPAMGATVVVIDNDSAVLGALKFALEIEGFAVVPYRSGAAVLAEREFPTLGCLVIDFKLPDVDGLSLLASLRDRAVKLPALLTTSNPSQPLRNRAAAAGVAIVEKPLLGNALVDAIQLALSELE
jgi:two-component system, LuxR family, response regulator FixJ